MLLRLALSERKQMPSGAEANWSAGRERPIDDLASRCTGSSNEVRTHARLLPMKFSLFVLSDDLKGHLDVCQSDMNCIRTTRERIETVSRSSKRMRVRAVPGVTRSMAILRTLAASDVPLGVGAIAHSTHTVPSTCLHILRALVEEGVVSINAGTRKYSLEHFPGRSNREGFPRRHESDSRFPLGQGGQS